MREYISIPNNATKYILYQRTELLRFDKFLSKWKIHKTFPPFYKMTVSLESLLFRSAIVKRYLDAIEEDFLSMEPYLPETCPTVLDIGCGIGVINIFISRKYCPDSPDFYLLDKTQTDRLIHYGFQQYGSFYNSLTLAKTILSKNGIPEYKIHLQEATDDYQIDVQSKIKMVISLISWGFHYPVDTYLPAVDGVLDFHGTLIIDIRNDSDGLKVLRKKFSDIQIIKENKKYSRVCAR